MTWRCRLFGHKPGDDFYRTCVRPYCGQWAGDRRWDYADTIHANRDEYNRKRAKYLKERDG